MKDQAPLYPWVALHVFEQGKMTAKAVLDKHGPGSLFSIVVADELMVMPIASRIIQQTWAPERGSAPLRPNALKQLADVILAYPQPWLDLGNDRSALSKVWLLDFKMSDMLLAIGTHVLVNADDAHLSQQDAESRSVALLLSLPYIEGVLAGPRIAAAKSREELTSGKSDVLKLLVDFRARKASPPDSPITKLALKPDAQDALIRWCSGSTSFLKYTNRTRPGLKDLWRVGNWLSSD